MSLKPQFLTHTVENQPLPLQDYDAWSTDLPLQEAVARHGASWAGTARAVRTATVPAATPASARLPRPITLRPHQCAEHQRGPLPVPASGS